MNRAHVDIGGPNVGGGVVNNLAVRMGSDLAAAVPFYGAQPNADDTAKIKTPIMTTLSPPRFSLGTIRRHVKRSADERG